MRAEFGTSGVVSARLSDALFSIISAKERIFFIMINSSSFVRGDKSMSIELNCFIPCSLAVRKILQIRACAY